MLGVVLLTLALVAGRVSMHPPAVTFDDNDGKVYTDIMPDGIGGEVYTDIMPSGKQNLKPVENKIQTLLKHVPEGDLYQADILLTEEQRASLKARKALDSTSQRWTEDTDGYPLVPYVFLDGMEQTATKESLALWAEHTCLKFEETSNTEQPHLQFFTGEDGACWSYVGMIPSWNGQKVSIGSGCNYVSVIVHEVGHAIGWWHEQSRSDRDGYVKILYENANPDYHSAFDKAEDNNYNVPYDYSSTMQYGAYSFSSNDKPTIVTLDPLDQPLLNSGEGLSHRDRLMANRMYGCIDKWLENCPGISSDPCLNDGYIKKDCTCACPPGTSGSNCETVTGGYYDNLRNPRSETITEEGTLTVKTPINVETFMKVITPPTCKSVKLQFTSEDMYEHCSYQFLNVKTTPTDYAGEKVCKEDVSAGKVFTSETGIIITMSNYVSGYTWEQTLWEAEITFEDISGCSGPTTTEPTTTTTLPTTTEAAPPLLACEDKPSKIKMEKGDAYTITSPGYPEPYSKNKIKCGWKLKATGKAELQVTCHTFELHAKDLLKVNKKTFKSDTGPSSVTSKSLNIKFVSKKKKTGPGFTCTVTAA